MKTSPVWNNRLMAVTCNIRVNNTAGFDSVLRNRGKKAMKKKITFGLVRLTARPWPKYDLAVLFNEEASA